GLHVGDRGAGLVADPGHVVLERSGERLELPPEERAPELAPLRGVVRRNLNVHRLAWHEPSSRSVCQRLLQGHHMTGRSVPTCREIVARFPPGFVANASPGAMYGSGEPPRQEPR